MALRDEARVRELAALLSIDPLLDRSVAKLSGGERRRVAIARALLTNPAVLLLDEPLAGIDTALSARMLDMLRDVRARVPIVLVSHDREEIAALCDDVVELDRGRGGGGPPRPPPPPTPAVSRRARCRRRARRPA
jgi:molybdate transport system ATP-binding protein